MKQKKLLKTLFLLFALIVGSSSVWAEKSYTITFNDTGTDSDSSTKVTSIEDIISEGASYVSSITNTSNVYNARTGRGLKLGTSKANGSLTLNLATAVTPTKITFKARQYGSSETRITVNGQEETELTTDFDEYTINYDGNTEVSAIAISTPSKRAYITEVTVYYEDGGSSEKSDCDLALTDDPVALTFDLYDNADDQVINYTTSSTGAVTVANSEYISAVVGNGTITVTPLKKTNGAVEITVNQAADDNYKAGSATFTVTITDSTPKTGAWVLTDLADLEAGDVFVIVGNNGDTYAMSNGVSASNPPSAVAVTVENDEITSDVADNIKWNIGNSTDGYTFYPNEDAENWLYCTNSNNGVRVGTGDAKHFTLTTGTNAGYLTTTETTKQRYIGIYNSQDWRCYDNINSNISGQTFAFYKYVDGTTPQKADPDLSFSSATAEATFGQDFTAPTLNTAAGFNGTVEYSSSVETVAQVMDTETGELRIVGGGTTVITATFAGNDDFKAGSASYTLTVTDNRIATTITQENIVLDIADIATLTQLTPVVKDASNNIVEYTNSPTAEGLPEVYFEVVSDDNEIFGSFDSHGNVLLNSVVGTATVKAVYNQFQLNENYRPSECTFTVTVESALNGIVEFCSLENGSTGTVRLTDAVVLYKNENDMFVRDNTGAIDFYNTGLDYSVGNILNGKITAKYSLFNNMPELTTPISNNTLVATDGTGVTPTEITTSDAADNACNLVKLSGVTVTTNNNKFYVDDVQVYDKFKLNYTIEAGKTYDIVGIMVPYSNTYEICPTEAPVEVVVTEPTLTVDPQDNPVNVDAGGVITNNNQQTIKVHYSNFTTELSYQTVASTVGVDYCDINGGAATYDWITSIEGNFAGDDNGDKYFTLLCEFDENNESTSRTAYVKVWAMNGQDKVYAADLVTITQVAPVTGDEYELFSGELVEGDYIIYYNGNAMKNTVDNGRLTYEEVTPDNDVITTGNATIVWHIAPFGEYWTIYSADADAYAAGTGAKNKAQMLADGTDDMALWTVTEEDGTYEFVNKKNAANSVNANLRNNGSYGFACYATNTGGALSLYKKVSTTPTEVTATISASGYTTLSSAYPLDFSGTITNLTAAYVVSELTATSAKFTQVTTAVPAETGLVLEGAKGATVTIPVALEAEALTTTNFLQACVNGGTVTANSVYALSGGKFKLYTGTELPAGKAYLLASDVPGNAPTLSFDFGGDVTGISTIDNGQQTTDNRWYDLSGRRVENPTKGMYIHNGKKVIVK